MTSTLLQILAVVQRAVSADEPAAPAALLSDQRDEHRILSLCDHGGAPR